MAGQTLGEAGSDAGITLPKRFPLVVAPSNRDDSTAKDARLVNCYMERSESGETWVVKRPGLDEQSRPPAGNAAGSGVYNWRGNLYSVFGAVFYKDGVATGGAVDATGGVYRFSSNLGATPKLQLGNGVKAYNYDASNGLVLISDADFPTSFCKGWAYLDTTTYVVKSDASIQGSGINDTVNWDALNTLTGQIEPDRGVAGAKQMVYVIEFKEWTTEVFYDAANATGSPLSPVQGAKVNWGCVSQDSVQELDDTLVWVGAGKSSAIQVIAMAGLKAQVVSTKAIERLLQGATWTAGQVFSWQMKKGGHHFYVLTLKTDNLTLALDLKEGIWWQMTDVDGNYFPIVSATYDSSHRPVLQHETNGRLYLASDSYLDDDGSLITVDIYTPNFDGGTRRNKQMNFLEFIADQTTGSELQVRNNDKDYDASSWTTYRKVDLSQIRPTLTACGTFRRRAYNLRHRGLTRFRIQAMEMQLALGTL